MPNLQKVPQCILKMCSQDLRSQWPWPLTSKIYSVYPWLQVNVCTKFAENPLRCSWDIAFMRHKVTVTLTFDLCTDECTEQPGHTKPPVLLSPCGGKKTSWNVTWVTTPSICSFFSPLSSSDHLEGAIQIQIIIIILLFIFFFLLGAKPVSQGLL